MTSSKLKRLPRHERPHELDLVGAVLLVGMSVATMLALNWGGVRYDWTSPVILGLAAISIMLVAGLVVRLRTAREPLIPISVLSNGVVFNGVISVCFAMSVLIGLIVYLPIYFEVVLGYSTDHAGLALVPLVMGTTIGAMITGRLMAGSASYKRPPMIGLSIAIAATLTLWLFARHLPFLVVEILLAALSMGLGTMLPVTTTALQTPCRGTKWEPPWRC